jgi:uncharacterized membrane-anchored protein YhcB (DUF1043 family)
MRLVLLVIAYYVFVLTIIVGKSTTGNGLIAGIISGAIFIVCIVMEIKNQNNKQAEIKVAQDNLKALSKTFDTLLKVTTVIN